MRYHIIMRSFVEKTSAEQGFGVSWRQEVVPLLERYEARRYWRTIVASLITGIAVGVGGVMLLQQFQIVKFDFLVPPLNQMLVLALAVLVALMTWMALLPVNGVFGGAVRRAVEVHFAGLLTPNTNAGFAEVILQDLVADDILPERHYAQTAAYAGAYGDCRIWMIEAATGRMPNHNHDMADLLVFRLSLPFRLQGETRADSQTDRLASIVAGRSDFVDYDADHDEFNDIFAIATTDTGAATQLFTAGFAETILQVHDHLASPLTRRRAAQPRFAMQVAHGSLVMVVDMLAGGGSSMTATDIEQRARALIVQFATLPALVDGLQAGVDTSPVFLTPISGHGAQSVMSG
jgi:hypothetical protein